MAWQEILGHDSILQRFQKSYHAGRLASTYLFVGPEGIGKRRFALTLAQALFCGQRTAELVSCQRCPSCQQVAAQAHPDLILVSKPDDKNFLPVELFVGDREHRRREGLCHDIHLTPFQAGRKIAIIDDADYFNAESANSLLKTLEEPPADSILILIGTSEHRQLPTILSRSQIIRFQPLATEDLRTVLVGLQLNGEVPIDSLVEAADGSVGRALFLDNEELFQFRQQLFEQLVSLDPSDHGFAKSMTDFVDSISKEGAVKRGLLRTLADFTIQLLDHSIAMALQTHKSRTRGPETTQFAQRLITNWSSATVSIDESLCEMIDRTLTFQRQVDANLSAANIVPAWLNDLGALARAF